jgi:hypothetical protein
MKVNKDDLVLPWLPKKAHLQNNWEFYRLSETPLLILPASKVTGKPIYWKNLPWNFAKVWSCYEIIILVED